MFIIFLLLTLVAIICLIIGAIRPSLIIRWGNPEKRTRKRAICFSGMTAIIFFILAMTVGVSNAGTISPINKRVGIGDKMTLLEEKLGKPKDGALKQFKNGDILVVDANDRAYNITIQKLPYENPPKLQTVEDYLPKDKKIISEYTDNKTGDTRYITIGESDLLKQELPSSEGKFVVIMRAYEPENKNSAVIGIGDNP